FALGTGDVRGRRGLAFPPGCHRASVHRCGLRSKAPPPSVQCAAGTAGHRSRASLLHKDSLPASSASHLHPPRCRAPLPSSFSHLRPLCSWSSCSPQLHTAPVSTDPN
ncbi:Os04g0543100, partial [Oryza sativa Japonica Group]